MTLREGEDVPLPTGVVRLDFGRPAGPGVPPADVRVLLRAEDGSVRDAGGLARPDGPGRDGAARPGGDLVNGGTVIDTLTIDLASVERGVISVLLTARGDGGPLGRLSGMWLRVGAEGSEPARCDCAGETTQTSYLLGECYRHGGGWRFRAGGEGYVPPTPRPPSPVTLTGDAPAVPLARQGATSGTLRVGLERDTAHGAWGADAGVGLDLCALFELSDGGKGVVQALGGALGSLHRPPFILLDGEHGADRSGPRGSGDHLTVNLDHLAHFRRILVFVTLFRGAPSFAGLRATVTLRPEHGAGVDFALDECAVPSTVCALALLTRDGPDLVVRREARHLVPRRGVSPQRTVDYAYGWGLDWTPGRT